MSRTALDGMPSARILGRHLRVPGARRRVVAG